MYLHAFDSIWGLQKLAIILIIKLSWFLYPRVRNSMTHLTMLYILITYMFCTFSLYLTRRFHLHIFTGKNSADSPKKNFTVSHEIQCTSTLNSNSNLFFKAQYLIYLFKFKKICRKYVLRYLINIFTGSQGLK